MTWLGFTIALLYLLCRCDVCGVARKRSEGAGAAAPAPSLLFLLRGVEVWLQEGKKKVGSIDKPC